MLDDLRFGRLLGFQRNDGRAVAHHGDPVADGKQLIKFMRDVDTGDSPASEIAQDIEQCQDLVLRQRGSRFIENEDVRIF